MNWPTLPISDLTETSQYGTSEKAGLVGDVPILRMGNITNTGKIDVSELKYINLPERDFDKYTVKRGDILFNRTNSPALVGKTAVYDDDESYAFAGYLVRLRINNLAEPRYVSAYLNSKRGKQILRSMAKSIVGMANINARELGSIKIPVPPLEEQRRIASILGEARQLIEASREVERHLSSLISSWFDEMFLRNVRCPLVGLLGTPSSVPEGWNVVQLTEVARLATGHTPSRREPKYWTGDVPWLTLGDVRALDGKIAQDTGEHITEAGIKNSSAVLLPSGTVCFARTASVGFVTVMGRQMATSQDFVNWVCGPHLNNIYLMWAIISAREHLIGLSSGSTHRTIYFPTVESFSVFVPPIELQNMFAERVRQVENARERNRIRLERHLDLFASLEYRAFDGEL